MNTPSNQQLRLKRLTLKHLGSPSGMAPLPTDQWQRLEGGVTPLWSVVAVSLAYSAYEMIGGVGAVERKLTQRNDRDGRAVQRAQSRGEGGS